MKVLPTKTKLTLVKWAWLSMFLANCSCIACLGAQVASNLVICLTTSTWHHIQENVSINCNHYVSYLSWLLIQCDIAIVILHSIFLCVIFGVCISCGVTGVNAMDMGISVTQWQGRSVTARTIQRVMSHVAAIRMETSVGSLNVPSAVTHTWAIP